MKHRIFFSLLLLMSVAGMRAQTIVTGRVLGDDEPDGLISATVVEQDKNGRVLTAVRTDYDGNFSIAVKSTENLLVFSYVGYTKQSLPIKAQRKFNVTLKSKNVMNEVVVKASRMVSSGGLAVPEREYTGAMQRFSTEKLEGMSITSIDDALQGRIAGLDIVANSGDLGSGTTMRIRGITSINSNNEPLILVNNIPFESNTEGFDFANADNEQFANLLCISPDDIAEVTVLKDGAACAIWGSRGANGVINITTKKGVTGPTRVSYSYRLSGNWQPKGTPLLNGDEYTMLMKQAYFNNYKQDVNIPEYSYDRQQFLNTYGTAADFNNFTQNTDWVDAVRKTGWTHDHLISIQGGGERARFRTSLGYYKQTGTIIKQGLRRFTGNMNLEYNVSKRLMFASEFSITYTDNDKNYNDGSVDGLLSIAYRKMPNTSIYRRDALGRPTNEFFNIAQSSVLNSDQKDLANPVAIARLASYQQTNMRIMPTLRLRYDFIDPDEGGKLRYQGYVKFDSENVKDAKFRPRETSTKQWSDGAVNRSYQRESEATTIYTDHNLTWMPRLGDDHSLMLYGSWQMDVSRSKIQQFERYGVPTTVGTDVSTGGRMVPESFYSAKNQGRNMAFLVNGHYMLLDRYIIDASARWDGSSRFGSDNRWGFFPSVSGKWIFTSEPWMKRVSEKWFSEGSLRLGWGVTGNRPDYEYLYFSRYDSYGSNYIDLPTIKPSSLQLSNLKWERSSSVNVGAEFSFANYKYRLVLNAYHRRTTDLLFSNQTIPSSTGFSSISYINAGTMDNNGWELEFSTNRMVKKGDWQFDVSLNLSNYRNTIKELDPMVLSTYQAEFSPENGNYLNRIQINNSFGSIYGFRYKGVYQYDKYSAVENPGVSGPNAPVVRNAEGNAVLDARGETVPMYFDYGRTSYRFRGGDAIYEDMNHDGTIDELDIVYLGNSNPKLDGGFGFTLRWKRLTINTWANFRLGSKVINYGRMYNENMYTTNNQSISTNWRWRKDGDVTKIPRALYQSGYNWLASDRFVESGSFLRLKQVTINYNFDANRIKRIGLNNLMLSLTLNNMLTLTKYTGADPEISPQGSDFGVAKDNNRTPRARYFTFGVTVGF